MSDAWRSGAVAELQRQSRRRFLMALGGIAGAAALGALGAGGRRAVARVAAATGLEAASRSGHALGSAVHMTVLHQDRMLAQEAMEAAFGELARVDGLMSIYRPASQLSALNRDRTLHDPHPYLVEVLRQAARISELSGGAFDVTVQPLWEAYAAAKRAGELPDDSQVRGALARVDWRKVEVSARRIRLNGNGMAITLNGIAQGYAADRAMAGLRERGIEHALVNTGEIGTLGRKADGQAWTIGIQHPRQADAYAALAKLEGRCMATSGDYATTFSADRAHNHILDPVTGVSPAVLSSVTVVAPTACEADALSTAVFVLGPERGLALLGSLERVDALLIRKDGGRVATTGFPKAG